MGKYKPDQHRVFFLTNQKLVLQLFLLLITQIIPIKCLKGVWRIAGQLTHPEEVVFGHCSVCVCVQGGSQPDREAAQGQDEQFHRRAGLAGAHMQRHVPQAGQAHRAQDGCPAHENTSWWVAWPFQVAFPRSHAFPLPFLPKRSKWIHFGRTPLFSYHLMFSVHSQLASPWSSKYPDISGGAWGWENNNFPSSDLWITTARLHSTKAPGAGGEREQRA